MPVERVNLNRLAARLRDGVSAMGMRVSSQASGPIVSLLFQKTRQAEELLRALFQRGILAEVVYQQKPLSEASALRFLVNSKHTEKHVDHVLESLSDTLPRVESLP
jgi:7-keto-8-aminopelargonate synthetase-like enzyme